VLVEDRLSVSAATEAAPRRPLTAPWEPEAGTLNARRVTPNLPKDGREIYSGARGEGEGTKGNESTTLFCQMRRVTSPIKPNRPLRLRRVDVVTCPRAGPAE
jgi:hypothetical protein